MNEVSEDDGELSTSIFLNEMARTLEDLVRKPSSTRHFVLEHGLPAARTGVVAAPHCQEWPIPATEHIEAGTADCRSRAIAAHGDQRVHLAEAGTVRLVRERGVVGSLFLGGEVIGGDRPDDGARSKVAQVLGCHRPIEQCFLVDDPAAVDAVVRPHQFAGKPPVASTKYLPWYSRLHNGYNAFHTRRSAVSTDNEPMYEHTAASRELAEAPVRLPDDDNAAKEVELSEPSSDPEGNPA